MRVLSGLALVLCGATTGCVSTPEFDRVSIVDRPRVLAIVAEPPGVVPGQGSELSLLMAGFDGLDHRISWSVCAAFFTDIRGSQYGAEPSDQGCSSDMAVEISTGPRATLPGAFTEALFDNLDLAAAALGSILPRDTVELVRREVGLPLLVEARIEYRDPSGSEQTYRAVKRVLVNRTRRFENPPPPRFAIDGTSLVPTATDMPGLFACAPEDGEPLEFSPAREVELAPIIDGGADAEESWLEDYVTLDARGDLQPRTERAFYSWFGTGGEFAQEVTRSPLRNELWTLPGEPGRHDLWLVVRDGHGGTSACHTSIRVQGGG
ncbi:MAG: hypothetical protein OXU20_12410 [Myxococcales bacterium]|nr:hypothetical protein [Myxococcales bacterium]MDD9968540.1 hypothetical protein [Myxococcales bacterium]